MTDRRPPVEFRAARVDDVDFSERIITVIAVPYEQPATVEYRGQVWQELFERGAFAGIDSKQTRIPVNREHNRELYVGLAQSFDPEYRDGLLTSLKIFETDRGDETLKIAADDGLSSSIGFAVRGSDQVLDRATMTRRIKRAFIVDHISLVAQPAYAGARVLSVRSDIAPDVALPPMETPALDGLLADPVLQWANARLQTP
jgi:phage head maturation protease